jgi:hypothetical protein
MQSGDDHRMKQLVPVPPLPHTTFISTLGLLFYAEERGSKLFLNIDNHLRKYFYWHFRENAMIFSSGTAFS